MKEIFTIYPGETFVMDGKNIMSDEGRMSGQVTLRLLANNGPYWPCEIISVSKPEWEWMLNKVLQMEATFVREQILLQF